MARTSDTLYPGAAPCLVISDNGLKALLLSKKPIICPEEIREECITAGLVNRIRITDFSFYVSTKGITNNMGIFVIQKRYNQVRMTGQNFLDLI